MRVKTVDDGQNISEWYTIPNDINRDSLKIALLGWYPVYKSTTFYPEQKYNILLIDRNTLETICTLDEINFNPVRHESSKWQKNDITRKTFSPCQIPKNVIAFKLIAEPAKDSGTSIKNDSPQDSREYFKGWKYHFVLIEKGENINNGNIEEESFSPENVSREYCQKSSTSGTNSYNPTIGVVCPPNLSKKEMQECLNWRRADDIGKECRKKNFLSIEMENSIKDFCAEKTDREDCICINRGYFDEYKLEKKINSGHDYCWYSPCSSGAFLRYESQVPQECSSQNCIVSYTIQGNGSVKFADNYTRQDCFNNTTQNNQNNIPEINNPVFKKTSNNENKFNFDKKYIFMLIGGVILVLMLNFLKK